MGHYGIVYIARNDKHPPDVYKVGGSSRDVDERMRELSNETATYGTFEAKAFFPVTDWERAEAECHRQLYKYREDKEFFKAPYNELVDVVRNVCVGYQPEAHADKPTDGMSKALFLEEAEPRKLDPVIRQLIDKRLGIVSEYSEYEDPTHWVNADWSHLKDKRSNGTVESRLEKQARHKAEKRYTYMDGVNSFLLDDKKMFIVWVLSVIFGAVALLLFY